MHGIRMLRVDDSSNVSAVGYDAHRSVLRIQFHGGGMYDYPDIQPAQFADLASCESVGKWVHAELVKKKHPFTPQTEIHRDGPPDHVFRFRNALELIATANASCPACQMMVETARNALGKS